MKLTFNEWKKLSEKEKGLRYKELSDHDKFMARVTAPMSFEVIGHVDVSEEEQQEAFEFFKDCVKYFHLDVDLDDDD